VISVCNVIRIASENKDKSGGIALWITIYEHDLLLTHGTFGSLMSACLYLSICWKIRVNLHVSSSDGSIHTVRTVNPL
jgi:hypothetical protein